jgi:transcriptional regulator with XRE-family HTH domain
MVRTDIIRQRRNQLGLTLADAAERAGMRSLIQWQKIESGTTRDPQVSTLLRIAKALRIKPERLLR